MKLWWKEYAAAMHKTRWIGVVGSIVVIFGAVQELHSIHSALSVADFPLGEELIAIVSQSVTLLTLVVLAFAIRVILLFSCKPHNHYWLVVSWFVSLASVLGYLWVFGPSPSPNRVCGEDGRCFTIYDMSGTDFAALTGIFFIFFSFLRTLITVAYVGSKYHRLQ